MIFDWNVFIIFSQWIEEKKPNNQEHATCDGNKDQWNHFVGEEVIFMVVKSQKISGQLKRKLTYGSQERERLIFFKRGKN